MLVDVVGTVLRIVFEHEDSRARPVRAVRNGFGQTADREIVVGDHRCGRVLARFRTGRMIATEPDDLESRQRFRLLETVEFAFPFGKSVDIRNVQIEGGKMRVDSSAQSRYVA